MKNPFILLYAGIAYVLAIFNIGYIVAFLADFDMPLIGGYGMPKTINTGRFDGNIWQAVTINALLVLGFGLHHSVTARASFKRWWTRYVPQYIERATYLYMTVAMTAMLVILWQPIPITIWRIEATWAVATIVSIYLMIWTMMFLATFHFGHFSFFGLAQAWQRIRGQGGGEPGFAARYLYAVIRHPISLGWMITPWVTPHLTIGQVVFAVSATIYILAATPFEEADLIGEFGERYHRYRREVPAFLPFGRRREVEAEPARGETP
jgi:methanethiol S-methyltransferase